MRAHTVALEVPGMALWHGPMIINLLSCMHMSAAAAYQAEPDCRRRRGQVVIKSKHLGQEAVQDPGGAAAKLWLFFMLRALQPCTKLAQGGGQCVV